MKLRAGIVFWLGLLVLFPTIPLLAFSAYTAQRYAEAQRATIETHQLSRTQSLANELEQFLARNLGYLGSLATSIHAQNGDIGALYADAQRMLAFNRDISAVTLIDGNDRLLFLTLRPLGQRFPANQIAAVRQVFETGKPVLSAVFRSPVDEGMVVAALAVPVFKDGKVVYCLRAIIRTTTLNTILTSDNLPEGWIAAVVDGSGVLAARSHSPEKFVGQPGSDQLLQAISKKSQGVWQGLTKDGIVTQTAYRPVGNWGWHIALGVPKASLVSPLREEIRQIILLGVVLLTAGLLLAVWFGRLISRSLKDTGKAARAVLTNEPITASNSGIIELDQMRETLTAVDEYGRLLENRVAERTQELQAAKARSQHFADRLERSIEEERQRVAREVHDQMGQVFTAIRLILQSIPRSAYPSGQEAALNQALDMGISSARRITAELRPPLLDDLGLAAALQHFAKEPALAGHLTIDVLVDDQECLSADQSLGLFRIFQEAVTNIKRHADARNVTLTGQREGAHYRLTIEDDGCGIDLGNVRSGAMGLINMQERAALMHGQCKIGRGQSGGTCVEVLLALDNSGDNIGHEIPAA